MLKRFWENKAIQLVLQIVLWLVVLPVSASFFAFFLTDIALVGWITFGGMMVLTFVQFVVLMLKDHISLPKWSEKIMPTLYQCVVLFGLPIAAMKIVVGLFVPVFFISATYLFWYVIVMYGLFYVSIRMYKKLDQHELLWYQWTATPFALVVGMAWGIFAPMPMAMYAVFLLLPVFAEVYRFFWLESDDYLQGQELE